MNLYIRNIFSSIIHLHYKKQMRIRDNTASGLRLLAKLLGFITASVWGSTSLRKPRARNSSLSVSFFCLFLRLISLLLYSPIYFLLHFFRLQVVLTFSSLLIRVFSFACFFLLSPFPYISLPIFSYPSVAEFYPSDIYILILPLLLPLINAAIVIVSIEY